MCPWRARGATAEARRAAEYAEEDEMAETMARRRRHQQQASDTYWTRARAKKERAVGREYNV